MYEKMGPLHARAYVLVICTPYVKTYSFRVVDEEGAAPFTDCRSFVPALLGVCCCIGFRRQVAAAVVADFRGRHLSK